MNKNIRYTSANIQAFYKNQRIKWEQFYKSEQVILSSLGLNSESKVLDIGCGCGGLGLALRERFGVKDYTGIEINSEAAVAARQLNPDAEIIEGDILEISGNKLSSSFDVVISFGCIDWNVQFTEMLNKAFALVAEGCFFISSFRLTNNNSVFDMDKAYQYINFDSKQEGEKAAYVILNGKDLMKNLKNLDTDEIRGYGYWGPPSKTAVLPYNKLCFSVFAVKKAANKTKTPKLILDLPEDLSLQ